METKQVSIPEFLSGGGEAGEILRIRNWKDTPLGDPATWPQSLKTCVRIILTSSQPMFVWWGPELINIYNDAYKTIVGGKHPHSFGAPARQVWKEIWHEIEPRVDTVMNQNIGTYDEALLLIMERNGYPEETYYTFSYSPIPGDKGGVGGIICANTSSTELIINERAIETLRELGSLNHNRTVESVYESAAAALEKNNKDFPFAAFFKIDEAGESAVAVAWAGNKEEYVDFPQTIDLRHPKEGTSNLCRAVETGQMVLVKNEGRRELIPKGFWEIVPSQILHIPLMSPNKDKPLAILTIGLNPYRQFNEVYRNFIKLIADQVALTLNNVIAYEEERKRAKALEEIDKAKTHFFSNISHEFRTPLTLILGSLENVFSKNSMLSQEESSDLKAAHRNTLRLLRLVNMLLEFSRIEAGRMVARYQPINISEFTTELSGAFRSTIEHAGLQFRVHVDDVDEPVYVDMEMWEKILLNLLSNAFKYTLSGAITVTLKKEDGLCVLKVKDTGVGIPAKELPHMFERFHRVQNSEGRSFEGTGIGLSLVYELVKLHGGTISVTSEQGKGSEFKVILPLGKAHLAPQQIVDKPSEYLSSSLLNTFIQENTAVAEEISSGNETRKKDLSIRVLVVDDNADMRAYIRSLLKDEYEVETAINGEDALEKIGKLKPHLVLSDIMMPVMDGNQLLKILKASSETSHIPVIFLSARAGDEAKAEGLQAGADDYLVKPFSSKEILSRVRAQVKLAQTRHHVNRQLYNLFDQAPVAIAVLKGKSMVIEVANDRMLELWGKTSKVLNKPVMEALPELKGQGFDKLLDEVLTSGERYLSYETPVRLVRNGREEEIFLKFIYEPLYEEDGEISGVIVMADDITQQVNAKRILEASEQRYRYLIQNLPIAVYTSDKEGKISLFNQAAVSLWGCEPQLGVDRWCGDSRVYKVDGLTSLSIEELPMVRVLNGETAVDREIIVIRSNGQKAVMRVDSALFYDTDGSISGAIHMLSDITHKKLAQDELESIIAERTMSLRQKNEELKKSEEKYHRMTEEVQDYAIILLDKDGTILNWNNGARKIKGYSDEEVIGKNFRIFYLPEDLETYLPEKLITQAIEAGRATHEGWRVRKNGTTFWGSVVITALHDDKNDIIGFSKVTRDLTEKKKAEDTMKKYMAELERQNAELEQFAYVSSHDLQEPLRKIRTFADLLDEQVKEEDHRKYLQKINSSAERMSNLIKDLLNYSRLSKEGEQFVSVDLNQILENVKADLEVVIRNTNALIVSDELPVLKGIPLQFNQLFLNLLSNALKFNVGQPVITIKASPATLYEIISAKLDPKWSYVKMVFADNGIGFEPHYSEQIFTIFQRLNTRQKFTGTGIGLAMCKKIVENHQGHIYAEGQVDKGATFTIYLPLK